MTDTALNFLNPVLRTTAVQKTAQPSAGSMQDFGAVLDKTAQKIEDSRQPSADNSATSKTQQPENGNDRTQQDRGVEDPGTVADEKVSDTASGTNENSSEGISSEKNPDEKISTQIPEEEPETKDTVDQVTVDEIAQALGQIIGQIKEILGITDEELLSGMEELDLQPYDLLDVDNLSRLVATISGEDSVISLVANEDLYMAVQDITEIVETHVSGLLDQTGLTDEELDVVLQRLQEMENQNPEDVSVETAGEQAVGETDANEQAGGVPIADEQVVKEPVANEQVVKESVIIREDNTKSDEQPAKQYDTLPENQQENPVEVTAKPQAQNAGKDAKGSDEKESGNFGQDHVSQNFQNNLGEVNDVAVPEGIEKFTSESTENIMRQLADMVKIIKNENLTEMELQLHPASLGTVNVSLTTKGGVVTAEFTTQNEAVKAAIEAQASQLRANLEEQGVKVEAIEVSVESHQMERNLDKNGQEQQRQAQEQETGRIQGIRRGRSSINLRAFASGEALEGEMQGADDATRIAMEIMAANGNTMDLFA